MPARPRLAEVEEMEDRLGPDYPTTLGLRVHEAEYLAERKLFAEAVTKLSAGSGHLSGAELARELPERAQAPGTPPGESRRLIRSALGARYFLVCFYVFWGVIVCNTLRTA